MEHDITPVLSDIENCYISTYERYQNSITQLDQMQEDIDIIKIAVTGHSKEINKLTGRSKKSKKYTGPYLVK